MTLERQIGRVRGKTLELCRRALAIRIFRFAVVGGAATVTYFLLGLLFVTLLGFPTLIGNTLAFVLSFVVSYAGQCLWTFEATGSHYKMLPRFAATQLAGLAINSGVIVGCMHLGLVYVEAMIVASIVAPAFVYFISKYWVFTQK